MPINCKCLAKQTYDRPCAEFLLWPLGPFITWQVKQELLSLAEAGKQPLRVRQPQNIRILLVAQLGTWKFGIRKDMLA